MKKKLYPWKDVIWDIAIEHCHLDPYRIEYEDIAEAATRLPTGLDSDLFQAIVNGVIEPLDENGNPFLSVNPSDLIDQAHVTEVAVNSWLSRSKYRFTWTPEVATQRRLFAQRKQEEVILVAIRSQKLDPYHLKEERFQRGDKSLIRDLVLRKSPELFGTAKVFDKAWERLRESKQIGSP